MRYCPACQQRYGDDVELCPNDRIMTLMVSDAPGDGFVGRVLDGRWSIEALLSEGGMGAVYRARQLSVDRPVAVKVIRQDASTDAVMVSRFYRESKALSALQHPNIVTMFDFGQDEATGALFMVMELLKGRSLYDWQQARERFALRDVVQIGEQLFAALSEVHGGGVVHRDLKPENIYVERTANGRLHVKLLDFGIARLDEPAMTRLTETGQLQGTPYYMAPEQIQGHPITERTDMYAAGAVLYELVAGVEPFQGDTLMAVLTQHLNDAPPPLASNWALDGPVHSELVGLIEALMAKAPEARPESSLWVWERFRGVLDRLEEGDEGAAEPIDAETPLEETASYGALARQDAFSETVQVRYDHGAGAPKTGGQLQTPERGQRASAPITDSRAELQAVREGARASQPLDALPSSKARAAAPALAPPAPSVRLADDALGQTFSKWSADEAAGDAAGDDLDDDDALVVARQPAWMPAAALLGGALVVLLALWGAGVFDSIPPTPDAPVERAESSPLAAPVPPVPDEGAAANAEDTADDQARGQDADASQDADGAALAESDAAPDAPEAVADLPPEREGKAPRGSGAGAQGKPPRKKAPSADLDAILKGMRKP